MLYETIAMESGLQKAAGWLPYATGAVTGGLVDTDNSAAGMIGGAGGGKLGEVLANLGLDHLSLKSLKALGRRGQSAISILGLLGGAAGGGKLSAMLDRHLGNPVQEPVDDAVATVKDKLEDIFG